MNRMLTGWLYAPSLERNFQTDAREACPSTDRPEEVVQADKEFLLALNCFANDPSSIALGSYRLGSPASDLWPFRQRDAELNESAAFSRGDFDVGDLAEAVEK